MSENIWCILVLVIFLAISTLIFSGQVDTTNQATQIETLQCAMPIQQGYPNTARTYNTVSASNNTLLLTCTDVHTPFGYDYAFGEPSVNFGWFFYTGDYINSLVEKAGAWLALNGNYLNATIPVSLISEVPLLAIPYGIVFLIGAYGIYNTLHPLKR